jgi:fructose-1,6-bisphosphatase/inositol monophosphatase family enzyme
MPIPNESVLAPTAVRGQGSWLEGERLAVLASTSLAQAVIGASLWNLLS